MKRCLMPPRPVSFLRLAVLLLVGALAASGCGGEKLVKVSGTALRGGKAVPNLGVHFVPEKGLASHGLTDESGHFDLLYTTGGEGAVVGSHTVWGQLPPDPTGTGRDAPPSGRSGGRAAPTQIWQLRDASNDGRSERGSGRNHAPF